VESDRKRRASKLSSMEGGEADNINESRQLDLWCGECEVGNSHPVGGSCSDCSNLPGVIEFSIEVLGKRGFNITSQEFSLKSRSMACICAGALGDQIQTR
jgi:hypothetical protein